MQDQLRTPSPEPRTTSYPGGRSGRGSARAGRRRGPPGASFRSHRVWVVIVVGAVVRRVAEVARRVVGRADRAGQEGLAVASNGGRDPSLPQVSTVATAKPLGIFVTDPSTPKATAEAFNVDGAVECCQIPWRPRRPARRLCRRRVRKARRGKRRSPPNPRRSLRCAARLHEAAAERENAEPLRSARARSHSDARPSTPRGSPWSTRRRGTAARRRRRRRRPHSSPRGRRSAACGLCTFRGASSPLIARQAPAGRSWCPPRLAEPPWSHGVPSTVMLNASSVLKSIPSLL